MSDELVVACRKVLKSLFKFNGEKKGVVRPPDDVMGAVALA